MNKKFMRLAIAAARRGTKRLEGGPFGACLVRRSKVLAVCHNTVLKKKDATAHAEVNAIRLASRRLGSHILKGCEIYSTTEPCPMCFSAIHWARIKKIYFGTTIRDAARLGFNEMPLPVTRLKKMGKSPVKLEGSVMRRECLRILKDWEAIEARTLY
jgi:tRNA(Arg) A34 adenosine deaminase TadA